MNKIATKIGSALVFTASVYMYTHGYHHWIIIVGGCLSALSLLDD